MVPIRGQLRHAGKHEPVPRDERLGYGLAKRRHLGLPGLGKCELANSNLADWDPSGGDCGSQSFGASLSASGPSIDWAYTQPDVCRSDETSLANDDMRLHYDYTSQSDDNSISYESGSECVTDGATSCGTWDLVQNDSHARFSSGWSTSDFYGCAVLFRNYHC